MLNGDEESYLTYGDYVYWLAFFFFFFVRRNEPHIREGFPQDWPEGKACWPFS